MPYLALQCFRGLTELAASFPKAINMPAQIIRVLLQTLKLACCYRANDRCYRG